MLLCYAKKCKDIRNFEKICISLIFCLRMTAVDVRNLIGVKGIKVQQLEVSRLLCCTTSFFPFFFGGLISILLNLGDKSSSWRTLCLSWSSLCLSVLFVQNKFHLFHVCFVGALVSVLFSIWMCVCTNTHLLNLLFFSRLFSTCLLHILFAGLFSVIRFSGQMLFAPCFYSLGSLYSPLTPCVWNRISFLLSFRDLILFVSSFRGTCSNAAPWICRDFFVVSFWLVRRRKKCCLFSMEGFVENHISSLPSDLCGPLSASNYQRIKFSTHLSFISRCMCAFNFHSYGWASDSPGSGCCFCDCTVIAHCIFLYLCVCVCVRACTCAFVGSWIQEHIFVSAPSLSLRCHCGVMTHLLRKPYSLWGQIWRSGMRKRDST